MWLEITPRRPDFCGQPPCPICYRWGENNGVSMTGLERMSLELTGKFLDELTETERTELQKVADRIHAGALMVPQPPLDKPPDADLGMSDAAHMDGWLAQHKAPTVPIKPLQLTLDQRDDWQAPAEKSVEDAAKKAKDLEKLKELASLTPAGRLDMYRQYMTTSPVNQFSGRSASTLILDDPIALIQRTPSYFWGGPSKGK